MKRKTFLKNREKSTLLEAVDTVVTFVAAGLLVLVVFGLFGMVAHEVYYLVFQHK